MDFQIEKVAELARLSLRPEEKNKLSQDLSKILGYIQSLSKLSTENVPPTSHVLDMENVFRKDSAKPSQVRESVLKHAPQTEGAFFKVPKVVDK